VDLSERDVIFVTLDSCRYDIARDSSTPNLDRLGSLVEAETAGTYTLPAHAAFFSGRLPTPVGSYYQIAHDRYSFIWRSGAARVARDAAPIVLDGTTVMDHYRRRGYRVVGAGGVGLFDPTEPRNWLPTLFEEFHYFGPSRRTDMVLLRTIRNRSDRLALSHSETLAQRCADAERFFLFVNCPSTHFPYTTPHSTLTAALVPLLTKVAELQYTKRGVAAGELTVDDSRVLMDMQRNALEWADERLGVLFTLLEHRRPLVVVCADHGEEFGEGGRFGHGHPHRSVTTVPLWSGVLEPSLRASV
jgi:arylsulfatase A-like enzyme